MDFARLGKFILPYVIVAFLAALFTNYIDTNKSNAVISDLKLSFEKERKELADAKSKALTEQAAKNKSLQNDLSVAEDKHQEELNIELTKNDQLTSDLNNANKRLSIQIARTRMCETSDNNSGNSGRSESETAFLSPDARQTYTSLRRNIILTESLLSRCQDRLEIIEKSVNGPASPAQTDPKSP